MRTIAVTGVSGALGQRLLARLAADRDVSEVVGVDRAPAPDWPPKLRFHPQDLATGTLDPLLRGCDAVVHLAWAEDGPNLDATRRLLDAVAAAGVSRFVHLSCATVYGAWADNHVPLLEDERLRPAPDFAPAVEKAEAERIVAEWSSRHPDVEVTVLRPAVILGDGTPGPLARALYPVLTIRGRAGGPPVQFVDADDVVSAIVWALDGRATGAFNVAADGWIDDETLRSLVGPPGRLPLSRRVAERAASVLHWARGGKAPLHAAAYGRHPFVVANDRLRATGWAPARTSEEALVASPLAAKWPELSPKRRQELSLGIAGAALTGAAAAAWALIRRARR